MNNYDEKTGVHYGVISQHTIHPDALGDIYIYGEDMDYQERKEELKESLTNWLNNEGLLPYGEEARRIFIEDIFDPIEEAFNDSYESDNPSIIYEKDGYVIQTTETNLFVIKSPYVTWAPPCSPCAPNAGNLDDAIDEFGYWKGLFDPNVHDISFHDFCIMEMANVSNSMGFARLSYCLGPDWFDDEKIPYPYALISDNGVIGEWIVPDKGEE